MSNCPHEQCLIDSFILALRQVQDRDLSIQHIHNQSCRSQTFADVEFTAMSGQRWAIEAKYCAQGKITTEIHTLFGDLLRETGRENRQNCKIGLLLHQQKENYFKNGVNRIARKKLAQFGGLVPVQAVFVFSPPVITKKTWREFYSGRPGALVR